jgi:hypothetical protein
MSNEYELADDDRQRLIYTKEQLMAPLLPGMEAPPHPMRLGDSEQAYYVDVPARTGRTAADATPDGPAPTVPTAETAQAGAALNTDGGRFLGRKSDFDESDFDKEGSR